MALPGIIKVTQRYVIQNAPTLLSAVAVTGTITAAYLTGKATFRAADIIREEEERRDLYEVPVGSFELKDKAKLVWKEYIPPALVVVGTIGCIISANSLSATRLAGLAAAYKLSEREFNEYREKALEKLGVKDEKRMRDEINEDLVRRNPPSDDIQILATEDEVIFLEKWTGRYFRSKMHLVKSAEVYVNNECLHNRYATLSDFYDQLGLARTQESSEIGWSLENPISLDFTTTLADGGSKPVIVMEYYNRPRILRDEQEQDYPGIH